MNNRIAKLYVISVIIALITLIPILGNILDTFKLLTLILLGISIYILKNQPNEVSRNAAIIMIVSCSVTILTSILLFILNVGTPNVISKINPLNSLFYYGLHFGTKGVILYLMSIMTGGVLKIIALVLTLINHKKIKSINSPSCIL